MAISPDLHASLALKQLAERAGLKCCPCTDTAITNNTPVPVAVTMAPSLQMFTINGQQVQAPCVIPVCADCRKLQLGIVSKTGLIAV
jgi:hypothetical protein